MVNVTPGKIETKSKITKHFTFVDMIFIIVGVVSILLIFSLKFSYAGKIAISVFIGLVVTLCVTTITTQKGYIELYEAFSYLIRRKVEPAIDFKDNPAVQFDKTMYIDGSHTAVIEINGIDFTILDNFTQEQMIMKLKGIIEPVNEGSIIKLDRMVDYTNYVENFENYKSKLTNEKLIDVCDIHQKYLKYYTDNINVKAKNLYLLIKDNNVNLIEEIWQNIKNVCTDGFLEVKRLEGDALVKFLAEFLDSDEYKTPEVKEKFKTISINGKAKKIVAVHKFPFTVGNAWLANLFDVDNATVVMNFKNYGGKNLRKSLDKALKEHGSNAMANNAEYSTIKEELGKREALDQVLDDYIYREEKMFDVQAYLMFDAGIEKEVLKKIKADKFIFDYASSCQKEAYINMLPYSRMELKYKRYKLLQLQAEVLAMGFPFIYRKLEDEQGIYLGAGSAPVFFDPFTRTEKRINSNMSIFGSSGTGKSFTMKKMILELSTRNVRFYILDPEDEYRELCNTLDGNYIDVAGDGKSRINIMQVFPSLRGNKEDTFVINISDDEVDLNDSYTDIAQHRTFLQEFFKAIFNELTMEQLLFIDDAVAKVYDDFQLDKIDNLLDYPADKFPTVDDLVDKIEYLAEHSPHDYVKQEYMKLSFLFKAFRKEGLYGALWNGYTTMKLDKQFNVLNFRSLFVNDNKAIANAQMLLVMRFINIELIKNKEWNRQQRQLNKNYETRYLVEIVDEGHNFVNAKYSIALDKMAITARQVRKYDGALWFATQNISDLVQNGELQDKTSAIIDNCKYSLILGMKPNSINHLVDLYSNSRPFTKPEIMRIADCRAGQVLLALDNDTRIAVDVEAFTEEVQYFDEKAYNKMMFESNAS